MAAILLLAGAGLAPGAHADGCPFVAIASGHRHSLAIDGDGQVWAWGGNDDGQVGDGTTIDRAFAVPVPGVSGAVAVAAGSGHSVALLADGTLRTWGRNVEGQLGVGTLDPHLTPVTPPLGGVVDIAAGSGHVLALLGDGTVRAWGANWFGSLGDGTMTPQSSPVDIRVTEVISVGAGDVHSLAVRRDGSAWAWGDNSAGQLGDGTFQTRPLPVLAVLGLSGVRELVGGSDFSFALLEDGTVRSWGSGFRGELGNGSPRSAVPIEVPALSQVVQIGVGSDHVLALRADGSVLAWGANTDFQCGDGSRLDRPEPHVVRRLPPATAVASGMHHSLVLCADGRLRGFGSNLRGQLGFPPPPDNEPTPVPVRGTGGCPALGDVVQVVAGGSNSFAVLDDGMLRAWGDNAKGVLADGTLNARPLPGHVDSLVDAAQLSVSETHGLAVTVDGRVLAWGDNVYGQLGLGFQSDIIPTPAEIPGLSGVRMVSAGYELSIAVLLDGTVRTWGSNSQGALGIGSTEEGSSVPVLVPGLSGVIQASAGKYHCLAVLADGTIRSWGAGGSGQLGVGNTSTARTPLEVPGLTGVRHVAAGVDHSFALLADGTVRSWGGNRYGQLGDGTTLQRLSPVAVTGLSGVVHLVAEVRHAVAVLADGTVRAWGGNDSGQCGTGVVGGNVIVPTAVAGITSATWTDVGKAYSLVVLDDGTVVGFGLAGQGALGTGAPSEAPTPVLLPCPGIVDPPPPPPALAEVEGLQIRAAAAGAPFIRDISWIDPRDWSSVDALFDIVGGRIADLRRDRGFASAECVATGLDESVYLDMLQPGSRWYLVALHAACVTDPWGSSFAPGGLDPRAELATLAPCH